MVLNRVNNSYSKRFVSFEKTSAYGDAARTGANYNELLVNILTLPPFGVIREIARVGETYWANQSVNGFMNRLLGNGEPV